MAIGTTEGDLTTENLNEMLEIEGELIDTREERKQKQEIVVANEEESKLSSETQSDLKYARDNMYEIIEAGQHALEELQDVARNSQHPRAYEVLQQTVKTMIEANERLVELNNTRKKLEEQSNSKTTKADVNVENAVFVGNTSDLQKLIAEQKKKNE